MAVPQWIIAHRTNWIWPKVVLCTPACSGLKVKRNLYRKRPPLQVPNKSQHRCCFPCSPLTPRKVPRTEGPCKVTWRFIEARAAGLAWKNLVQLLMLVRLHCLFWNFISIAAGDPENLEAPLTVLSKSRPQRTINLVIQAPSLPCLWLWTQEMQYWVHGLLSRNLTVI